jgi:hypothetical protein
MESRERGKKVYTIQLMNVLPMGIFLMELNLNDLTIENGELIKTTEFLRQFFSRIVLRGLFQISTFFVCFLAAASTLIFSCLFRRRFWTRFCSESVEGWKKDKNILRQSMRAEILGIFLSAIIAAFLITRKLLLSSVASNVVF